MLTNSNLRKAHKEKNNEFYTQYDDIQNELNHYVKHFKNKVVFCNCDDPFESNFFRFFIKNFNYYGLKRLICTCYKGSPMAFTIFDYLKDDNNEILDRWNGYIIDIKSVPMKNGRGVSDEDIENLLRSKNKGVKKLEGDGDFRSKEVIEYLKQADIICTNPPFSLFREYVAQLIEYKKKFIIIGHQNAIGYKEIFPLIRDNKLWIGYRFNRRVGGKNMTFRVPDDYPLSGTEVFVGEDKKKYISVAGTGWFTNLDIDKRHEDLPLVKKYNKEEYRKFENFNAINVDKTNDIPQDYKGIMGVPITFMDKYNPEQFEIIGLGIANLGLSCGVKPYKKEHKEYRKNIQKRGAVDGDLYMLDKKGHPEVPYSRILIKNKRLV